MRSFARSALFISLALGLASGPVLAKTAPKKAAPAKKAPAAKKPAPPAKPAKPAVAPMVDAEHKKALAEKFAGFKFGMTKDEVLKVLQKQIEDRFEEKIKATTDMAQQDHFRKDRKAELARIAQTYVKFDGKKTGWD